MFDSFQCHGLQPTRFLCPWDCPSKNTGVGCHFLLQGVKLTSSALAALAGGFFTAEPPGKVSVMCSQKYPNSAMRIKWENYLWSASSYSVDSRCSVNDTPSFALLFNHVTFLIPVVFVLPWFCFQTIPFLPTSPIWILLTLLVPSQLESFSQRSSAHEEVSSSQSLYDLHPICLIWANPYPVFPAIRVFLTSSYSAHWSPWMFWTAVESEALSTFWSWTSKEEIPGLLLVMSHRRLTCSWKRWTKEWQEQQW